MVPVLFAVTLFVSAALLFLVQPLVGKLLLPTLGGTPGVWNTCLAFFQSLLLLGYLYAHLSLDRLGPRRQPLVHLAILTLPILFILTAVALAGSPVPVVASLIPADTDYPILPLLALLLVAVGVPFLVLAATGPLLQRWLAATPYFRKDPYVLYAASNAGSLLGLLAYPLVVEPTLDLTAQQWLWAAGLGVFVVLVAACGLLVRPVAQDLPTATPPPLPRGRVYRWLGLSALTAALLNAVTAHLTTDLAPMPLLWVVPLGLYLVSFILVFARWPERLHLLVSRVTPMLLLFLFVVLLTGATEPVSIVLALHLGTFFAAVLLCHGELARDRPHSSQLTRFYLILSLGGVLGGLGTALLAPLLFHRLGVLEYPLALALVALVRPTPLDRPTWADVVAPALLGLLTVALLLALPHVLGPPAPSDVADRLVRSGLGLGVPCVLAYLFVGRPVRYALTLVGLFAASGIDPGPNGRPLHTERNFFGTVRVTQSPDGEFVRLVHGTTQHGQQRVGDDTPLMYYHPTGPAGRVLGKLPADRRKRVGVVGLGCGAMAGLARPGEEWAFFEIDPAVIRVARDPRYFTYLDRCKGNLRVVPGDARLQLEREADSSFDVLALDAFSSDAIPVHLLTREALALYRRKLAPGGVLLFHVSNRYLDLPPLLGQLAAEAGWYARVDHDIATADQEARGKRRSTWVVLAASREDVRNVATDANWQPIPALRGPVWTDDFSNLLGVWRWGDE